MGTHARVALSATLGCALLGLAVGPGPAAAAQEKPDVQRLIKDLKSGDAFARFKAASALGRLGAAAKDAVPALEEAARDSDPDVRQVARRALDVIRKAVSKEPAGEKDEDPLRPLLVKLASRQLADRAEAVEELAKLGPEARAAIGPMIEYGLLSPSRTLQGKTADVLKEIDPILHRNVIDLLFDGDEGIRDDAARALGDLGEKAAPAFPALKYHYSRVVSSRNALKWIRGIRTLDSMVRVRPDDPLVVREVLRLVTAPNSPAREPAIGLLPFVRIDAKQRVAALARALADPRCRALAAAELGKLGPAARPALPALERLKLDPDAKVREAVSNAIQAIEKE
ncbi:MAG TPA: HEAT repeat domain-containing protein [Gemmataceae bacterium]